MISLFIPIRKGSKRIRDKNFRKLPGFKFGLTEIKIKQIEKFRNLVKKKKIKQSFEYVVSTNCTKTIDFLKKYEWIKIHERPKKLAMDDSLDDLIKIVPKVCSGDFILWTHVTSPLFDHREYLKFIMIFLKKKKFRSGFSADLIKKFVFSPTKKWISHNNSQKKWPRTQDLKPLYVANSAVFFAKKNVYVKNNNRVCNNPLPIISDTNKSFDIDDMDDFKKITKIIKSGQKVI